MVWATSSTQSGERIGNRHACKAPHGCYPCKATKDEDEWIALSVADQKEWETLCQMMGNPGWTQQEMFSDELSRWENQDELDKHLAEWTRQYGAYALSARLQEAGIMAAPSLSTKQFTHDEHIATRGFFQKPHHAILGDRILAGIPIHFSEYPTWTITTPPLLGEHNDYVFGELLGYPKRK
jgi:crotonobetainyl-CoA:carnitine CoA-transferase CaiB-like acyl-CoA transferase